MKRHNNCYKYLNLNHAGSQKKRVTIEKMKQHFCNHKATPSRASSHVDQDHQNREKDNLPCQQQNQSYFKNIIQRKKGCCRQVLLAMIGSLHEITIHIIKYMKWHTPAIRIKCQPRNPSATLYLKIKCEWIILFMQWLSYGNIGQEEAKQESAHRTQAAYFCGETTYRS